MKKAINILSSIMVSVLVILALALVGVRLFALSPYTVLSASMEPSYPVGSLIYVQSVEASQIEVGDPISFVLNEDLVVATHRVVEVDLEKSHFITKGDANTSVDGAPVHFENLLGRVVFSVPYLGFIAHFIGTQTGRLVAIAFILFLLLLLVLPELLSADKGSKKVQVADSIDTDSTADKAVIRAHNRK